ncbi:MAG: pyruvate kinase [Halothiobacillus sp.]|jgi:pyruvate kinase|nr:pyruvate kinase [Halothiobacillus sp.]
MRSSLAPAATSLQEQIETLRQAGAQLEGQHADELARIDPHFQASARNLLHYLGVRQHDIRHLQRELAHLGLSSFGILESHVMASLNAVTQRLEDMAGKHESMPLPEPVDLKNGLRLLQEHTRSLLGDAQGDREVRLMVTLPSEAATDLNLIPSLIEAGMEVARINCAHDDISTWRNMTAQVRSAALALSRPCRVQADLAGPKSRTGTIRAQGKLLKIRPKRDFRGRVVQAARLWITRESQPSPPPSADIAHLFLRPQQAEGQWGKLDPDTQFELTDARAHRCKGWLLEQSPAGLLIGFAHTAYIEDGTPLHATDPHILRGLLIGAPLIPEEIRLQIGDVLILSRMNIPGSAARILDGQIEPARLHCTLEAAFRDAQPDQSVWLDDGRIGGLIAANDGDRITVTITHADPAGSRLKEEKGINFPDTDFHTPALTDKDIADLNALAHEVDIIALSFLRNPEDVALLQDHLARLDACQTGIVLKIENRQAFQHLPRILLTGMRSPRLGVMIARGDLAVELGFERLSEVQEEILWLCEAAHIPVIWATQILENMAKNGSPSRAEVTDAAMSIRAECVMLNKGPHIIETLRFLGAVLGRMEGHYSKRMAMRRKLTIADLN